MTVKTL